MSDLRQALPILWGLEARYRSLADDLKGMAEALEKVAESSEMAEERASALSLAGDMLSDAAKASLSGTGTVLARPRPRKKTDAERLRPFLDRMKQE